MKEVWLMIHMLLPADPATEMVFPNLVTSLPVDGSYFFNSQEECESVLFKKGKSQERELLTYKNSFITRYVFSGGDSVSVELCMRLRSEFINLENVN